MYAVTPRKDPMTRWWWSLDRPILGAVVVLACIGALLSLAASPSVARTHDLPEFHFVVRQIAFLVPALAIMCLLTWLDIVRVQLLAFGLLAVSLVALVLCLVAGPEINGAQRWLMLGPISVQPSEFAKPAFVVVAAFLIARGLERPAFPGLLSAFAVYAVLLGLLVMQPDFGQAVLVTAAWATLFFLAGTPLSWSAGLLGVAAGGAFCAYRFVPHVASRVDRFLDPSSGDTYQIDQSLAAFARGGITGQGPGGGDVKLGLPDAHTDFIFAVAGEEFGLIACLFVAGLFALVVLRGLDRALAARDLFVKLAVSGLAVLFGFQAIINMGVNLALLPAKGMTLPFISYGGSSLLALAVTMGFLLALTRRRPGPALDDGGPV
ncbi:MAG: putative lipid II flippase FtsW [Alphaproteobacteria bacterium]|nr:putative lipid II flippase FtsW [Alphaproteobacteria bacterium]